MTTAEPHSGPAAQGSDGFSIVRVAERHQYELRDGELTIGFAKYREQPGRITFTHTVVDSAYEGRGLGSRIARHVLDEAVADKLRGNTRCTGNDRRCCTDDPARGCGRSVAWRFCPQQQSQCAVFRCRE